MSKARLNFVIPNELDRKLTAYCDETNRTPTEVIRQLVIEWLEGDRLLAEKARTHPAGRRTNIVLSHASREALESLVRTEGHATTSAAVSALLGAFLAARPAAGEPTVVVRIRLLLSAFRSFARVCATDGRTVDEDFQLHAKERVARAQGQLKEMV